MSDVNSKKYSLELLKSQFVLDSESPSGLSWIGKKKRKQARFSIVVSFILEIILVGV